MAHGPLFFYKIWKTVYSQEAGLEWVGRVVVNTPISVSYDCGAFWTVLLIFCSYFPLAL